MKTKILKITAAVLGIPAILAGSLFALVYFTTAGDYPVLSTTAYDPSLPFIEIEGYRFHAESYGNPENTAVIVLHGGPGGDYRSILPLKNLADDYYVVFYDQRGAGLSPRVEEDDLTMEQYLRDLNNIIDSVSPDRSVILIGHSWGAMLASSYIGRYPGRVERAVLAEPGFLDQEHKEIFEARTGLSDMKPSLKLMILLTRFWGESLHVKNKEPQAGTDYLLTRFFTAEIENHPLAGYYRDDKLENAAGESWRFGSKASHSVPASGIGEDGTLMDLADGVDKWEEKALFLAGSENSIIGPDFQRDQMKRFPRAELAVIEGAGHTMIGEKPEECLRIIRDYLAE